MDFEKVGKEYRAVPFWSWNDRLNTEETRRQVGVMDDAGIGGFMMHARGGLLTEYMGEEWFDNVAAAIDEAQKRGMHPWAYDENGWPSGFGDGKVTALGVSYQQKFLDVARAEIEVENVLLEKDGYKYYYTVNPYYVDVMDEGVIAKFIEEVYEKYYQRFGNTFDGFFTDEPQMMNNRAGYPWSFTLPGKFKAKYGYDLVENLDALFFENEKSKKVRRDFWYLVTNLFSESFFKQIGDWCRAHGYGFTGHLMMEDTMSFQIRSSGAAMPHYEYFTHPGMDWLGRRTDEDLTAKQLGSAAAQMGQKQVLSETFALCGHNVTLAELKGIYEQQLVKGINLLCTHLEGYTNKGKRKRDYPPALYFQQPWWDDAKLFFDAMARVGMVLAEGETVADTLLLHPQTAAWEMYDGKTGGSAFESINELNARLIADMRELEDKHILYHLGDEIMLERHAKVIDGMLIIGKMRYSTVIIPEYSSPLPFTEKLIEEFKLAGGTVLYSTEDIAANPICAPCHIAYTMRRYADFDIHYFVNTNAEKTALEITRGNLLLNIETGKTEPFGGKITLDRYESAVVIDTHTERAPVKEAPAYPLLDLRGEWSVKSASYNSITLDRCDYSVDGGEWVKNAYVLDILPRLNSLRRAAVLEMKYRFTCEELTGEMFLVTETPEIFEIEINGKHLEKTDAGFLRDTAFRMLPIADLLKVGENEIYLKTTVVQSPACYDHIDNSWTCETMRNCLAFDMEIEQIYIAGNFGVRLDGEREELCRGAYRIKKCPVITAAPKVVDIENLDLSGYPTFAGKLTLKRTFNIADTHTRVKLKGRGITSVHISVNGKEVAKRLWSPYEVDLADYLTVGENTVELTLLGNLRNMQGPFHLKEGESYSVAPSHFYREPNVITTGAGRIGEENVLKWWNDDICLVHYGLDFTDTKD